MYDERIVTPMRQELTRLGVEEMRTPEEVDAKLKNLKGTALIVVNSVCGCAARNARPAIAQALQHPVKPDKLTTVFAGQDAEAVQRVADQRRVCRRVALVEAGRRVVVVVATARRGVALTNVEDLIRYRVAVVGVGHLGKHHARILSSLPGVDLVAVVDTNRPRAEEIAAAHGTKPASDYRELLGLVDAVTLAVPTERHCEIALALFEARVPVLVEKPMARSLAEADAMIAAAAKAGVAFGVGQTERFNPAVEAARPLLTDPRFVEVHRLGTFPERSLDIDVVFDLMIHDLDVVLSIVKSEVESIEAVGVPVLTGRVDIANARLRFANGCIVNLTASRISRDRVRKIRFFQPAAYLSIDYAAQKIAQWTLVKGDGPTPSIQAGDVAVVNEEPLKRELADFVDAVVSGRKPLVTGEQGRRALAVAQAITDRINATMHQRTNAH